MIKCDYCAIRLKCCHLRSIDCSNHDWSSFIPIHIGECDNCHRPLYGDDDVFEAKIFNKTLLLCDDCCACKEGLEVM